MASRNSPVLPSDYCLRFTSDFGWARISKYYSEPCRDVALER